MKRPTRAVLCRAKAIARKHPGACRPALVAKCGIGPRGGEVSPCLCRKEAAAELRR